MLPIELGYGLMIAGALLVIAGVVGLALRRNKKDEADPVVLPGEAPWKEPPADWPPGLLNNPNVRASFPHGSEQRTRTGSANQEN
jgi:hypothetical protein